MQLTPIPFETMIRAIPRTALVVVASVVLALGAVIGSARPVAACSCAPFQSMKDYATADNAIFTGIAGLRQARGVPVEVDQWLWGEGAAAVVWLADASFGDGAACGTSPPPPETAWIWVTWRDPQTNEFLTGLCSPAAMLDTDEGKAMLEEATTVFGGASPPTAAPEPIDAAPRPTGTPEPVDPTAADRDAAGLIVGAGVVLASLGLFGGLAFVARRQQRRA